MKAKARLTIGGGRDFDNGRVSDSNQIFSLMCSHTHTRIYGIGRDYLARDASTKRIADPRKIKHTVINMINDTCLISFKRLFA